MHQSQFGTSGFIGGRSGGGARRESFRLLGGEPATKDIFDGIDFIADALQVVRLSKISLSPVETIKRCAFLPPTLFQTALMCIPRRRSCPRSFIVRSRAEAVGLRISQFGTSGFIGRKERRRGVRRESNFGFAGRRTGDKRYFRWYRPYLEHASARAAAEIAALTGKLVDGFTDSNPLASMPLLLEIHSKLNALQLDPLIREKRQSLDLIIQHCLGLVVETTIPDAEVVPGEKLRLRHSDQVSSNYPVRWLGAINPNLSGSIGNAIALRQGEPSFLEESRLLPSDTLSQPYWLRHEPTAGMFVVDNPSDIGLPENRPVFPLDYVFSVGEQSISIPTEPVQLIFASVSDSPLSRISFLTDLSRGGKRCGLLVVCLHRLRRLEGLR